MKTSDIEPNQHYAAHLGGHSWQIAEIIVRGRNGSQPGLVDVEVIHPDEDADQAKSEPFDIRTVETKKVLGPWEAHPVPQTRQTDHVARRSDPTAPRGTPRTTVHSTGDYKTFAEHAADEYAKVARYNELAARLSEVGIARKQMSWLAKGYDRTADWYSPEKVARIGLEPDELAQLLFLAGNRATASTEGHQPPAGWLVTDYHPRMDGHVDAVAAIIKTLYDPHQHEHAQRYAADPGPVDSQLQRGPLRVYRLVRDS